MFSPILISSLNFFQPFHPPIPGPPPPSMTQKMKKEKKKKKKKMKKRKKIPVFPLSCGQVKGWRGRKVGRRGEGGRAEKILLQKRKGKRHL